MNRSVSPRAVRGVSMIEVLVAIVIFSLGLIGLALMQLKGATFTKEAGSRTMAVLQARSMVDRMQANPAGVAAGDYAKYAGPSSSIAPVMQVPCSGSSSGVADCAAQNDVIEWLAQIKAAAPASATGAHYGEISNNPDGSYTITVSWNGLIEQGGSTDVKESVLFVPPQLGGGP